MHRLVLVLLVTGGMLGCDAEPPRPDTQRPNSRKAKREATPATDKRTPVPVQPSPAGDTEPDSAEKPAKPAPPLDPVFGPGNPLSKRLAIQVMVAKSEVAPKERIEFRVRLRNIGKTSIRVLRPVGEGGEGGWMVLYLPEIKPPGFKGLVSYGVSAKGTVPRPLTADDVVELAPGESFDCRPPWDAWDVDFMQKPGSYVLRGRYRVMHKGVHGRRPHRDLESAATPEVRKLLESVPEGEVWSDSIKLTRLAR